MNRSLNYLFVFLYIMACNTIKKPESENLKRVWMLTEFKTYNKAELEKKQAYLDLTKLENASAKMGCNQMAFPYKTFDDGKIEFYPGLSTKLYCEDMKLEDEFSKSITEIESFKINENELTLTTHSGDKMIFNSKE